METLFYTGTVKEQICNLIIENIKAVVNQNTDMVHEHTNQIQHCEEEHPRSHKINPNQIPNYQTSKMAQNTKPQSIKPQNDKTQNVSQLHQNHKPCIEPTKGN